MERYCAEVNAAEKLDPGCLPGAYDIQAPRHTIPIIASNCTYFIETVEVGGERTASKKVTIVTCEFTDPHGVVKDVTPRVKYWHSLLGTTDEFRASLDPTLLELLETYQTYDQPHQQ